jgi:hypothetical protein
MTKIVGYRANFGGPNQEHAHALEEHLEVFHGFLTIDAISIQRMQFETGALADWLAAQGKTSDEAVHDAEHGEGYVFAPWSREEQDRVYALGPDIDYAYSTPHHHEGNIVIVDMELDLDDDMIENQP